MDADERRDIENLRKMSEKQRKEKISEIKYVLTRNKFAHADLFYPITHLSNLIPFNKQEWLDYGERDTEWWTSTPETVAYVHLFKTLRFIKAFTDLLTQKHEECGKLKAEPKELIII
jgi:hypothetical protein